MIIHETSDELQLLVKELRRDGWMRSRSLPIQAADAIEDLARWKAEALTVLTEWDACYDILEAAGYDAPIGRSKARHVADYLKQVVDQRIDDQLDTLRRNGWKLVECREYGVLGRGGYVVIFWSMYGWRQPQFTAPTVTGAIAAAFADLNDKDGFD